MKYLNLLVFLILPIVSFAQTAAQYPVTGLATAGYNPVFLGATAAIGGSVLLAGACSTGTINVTGATTSMVAVASPVTAQPNGVQWQAYVSSAGVVTVNVCAIVGLTPTSSVYNVRVIP
jgi:hypothetical protein